MELLIQWALLIGAIYLLAKTGLLYLAMCALSAWMMVFTWRRTRHWTEADRKAFWRKAYGPLPGERRRRRRR